MPRNAGVYLKGDLKTLSQSKNRKDWTIEDFPSGANKAEALSKDVVAILEGSRITILAPSGAIGEAFSQIIKERGLKGI